MDILFFVHLYKTCTVAEIDFYGFIFYKKFVVTHRQMQYDTDKGREDHVIFIISNIKDVSNGQKLLLEEDADSRDSRSDL